MHGNVLWLDPRGEAAKRSISGRTGGPPRETKGKLHSHVLKFPTRERVRTFCGADRHHVVEFGVRIFGGERGGRKRFRLRSNEGRGGEAENPEGMDVRHDTEKGRGEWYIWRETAWVCA